MEIVDWSMSERLKSTLCEDALTMAIRNRRPPRGLIHHSDRGVQYACGDDRRLLKLQGQSRTLRIHRDLLQSPTATLEHWLPDARTSKDGHHQRKACIDQHRPGPAEESNVSFAFASSVLKQSIGEPIQQVPSPCAWAESIEFWPARQHSSKRPEMMIKTGPSQKILKSGYASQPQPGDDGRLQSSLRLFQGRQFVRHPARH